MNKNEKTYTYTTYTTEQLEKELGTSSSSGLSQIQAAAAKKKYGANEIAEKTVSSYALFLRQFTSPFTYLLLGAALLSAVVGDHLNASIILLIVVVNGLLSFYQEYHAEQALKLLKGHLVMKAKVIRNGQEIVIPNTDLVPGDLLLLQPGDYIPADVRLIEGGITIDESILTGESAPVKKISDPLETEAKDVYQATNSGFLGTMVTAGTAKALVVATGSNTAFGSISQLSLQIMRESSFQQLLRKMSYFILALICVTLVVLFLFHIIIHRNQDIIQLLLFCIAIALGITPEALPTVTTFALSQGALQLANHNVIVKRLASIEDLGSITILCTDKTGTLTENKLTVVNTYYANEKNTLDVSALLAAKKVKATDPFDTALWEAASAQAKQEESEYNRVLEIPFDPSKRRNTVVVEKNGEQYIITRGALEAVSELCTQKPNGELAKWIEAQAQKGNRVLAIASKKLEKAVTALEKKQETEEIRKSLEHTLTFNGCIAFQDPIKKTAIEAIQKAHNMGISIKMITGDSKEIACAVAQAVGLVDNQKCGLSGAEFAELSDTEKRKAVKKYAVFARILPEQKFEIINLLKDEPHAIVGYLGEGINDAPALKAAHVGLVVQGASDIAKDAADIILLRKSLMTIIEGIGLGRSVFSNTLKYIIATLSATFGNFYSLAIASLILPFLPMLPFQVLLVNLFSDFPMVAIATDTIDPDALKRPEEFNLKNIGFLALLLGLVCPLFDFSFFAIFYHLGAKAVQTNWFIQSVLMTLALIYSVRTRHLFFKTRRPSFLLLSLSVIVAIITISLPFTTLGKRVFLFEATNFTRLGIVFLIVIAYFITNEVVKLLYFHFTATHREKTKKHH